MRVAEAAPVRAANSNKAFEPAGLGTACGGCRPQPVLAPVRTATAASPPPLSPAPMPVAESAPVRPANSNKAFEPPPAGHRQRPPPCRSRFRSRLRPLRHRHLSPAPMPLPVSAGAPGKSQQGVRASAGLDTAGDRRRAAARAASGSNGGCCGTTTDAGRQSGTGESGKSEQGLRAAIWLDASGDRRRASTRTGPDPDAGCSATAAATFAARGAAGCRSGTRASGQSQQGLRAAIWLDAAKSRANCQPGHRATQFGVDTRRCDDTAAGFGTSAAWGSAANGERGNRSRGASTQCQRGANSGTNRHHPLCQPLG